MTDGHDGAAGEPTDEESGESRGHADSGTEWNQPWPSERPPEDTSGNGGSTRGTNADRSTVGDNSGSQAEQRGTSGQTPSGDTRRSSRAKREPTDDTTTGSGNGGEIYVSEDVRDDGDWIDLADRRPEGTHFGPSTLSEEELREYITDERSLNPLVQIHWSVRVVFGGLIAGLIGSFGLLRLGYPSWWGGILVGVLLLLGVTWVFLYYRVWMYQVQADAIYLERGVVTHVRSLVPYVRIQHVDTSRSPIERVLGLSTLVIYTAGSRGADITIPGLLPDEARDLQRRVKELAIEADGDDAL